MSRTIDLEGLNPTSHGPHSDGPYTIAVRVEPPTFERHDEQNGDRYGESVEATFEDAGAGIGQG